MKRLTFTHFFWTFFVLNLVFGIVSINILPFKTPGEKTGFILSTNTLYFIPYGILVLFTRLSIFINRKRELENKYKRISASLFMSPIIAFIGTFNLCFFTIPEAILKNDYMSLNAISMALGLLFGGLNALFQIKRYNSETNGTNI